MEAVEHAFVDRLHRASESELGSTKFMRRFTHYEAHGVPLI